jgi:hypothetical protein
MLVSTARAYPSVLHFRVRLVAMTRNIRVEMVPSDNLTSLQYSCINGTACFFAFSLIIGGTTEKVQQFKMPVKSVYNKNLGFIEPKILF